MQFIIYTNVRYLFKAENTLEYIFNISLLYPLLYSPARLFKTLSSRFSVTLPDDNLWPNHIGCSYYL